MNKKLSLETIEMIKVCGCKDCIDKDNCNGIDLMNCYIIQRLSINKLIKKKKKEIVL
jgi:hypothetical protein